VRVLLCQTLELRANVCNVATGGPINILGTIATIYGTHIRTSAEELATAQGVDHASVALDEEFGATANGTSMNDGTGEAEPAGDALEERSAEDDETNLMSSTGSSNKD